MGKVDREVTQWPNVFPNYIEGKLVVEHSNVMEHLGKLGEDEMNR